MIFFFIRNGIYGKKHVKIGNTVIDETSACEVAARKTTNVNTVPTSKPFGIYCFWNTTNAPISKQNL